MDNKLHETSNLCVEMMNSKRQVKGMETWSFGTNSHLPFDVNVMLNLSINTVSRKKIIFTWCHGSHICVQNNESAAMFVHQKILWELYSFHMLKLTFIPSNLPSYWPRENDLLRLFIIRTNRVKGVVFMFFFLYIYI